MPWAAPRFCKTPGHPAFTGRRCPECSKVWDRERGSASSRGYDQHWRQLREAVLAAEPLCRFCAAQGRVTAATEADHIQPLRLRPDLRLVPSNIRPLCTPCHRQVTAGFNRERGGGGRSQEGIGGCRSGLPGPETEPHTAHEFSPPMDSSGKGPS
ncbi:HNH endonuclease [Roseomonas sp. KE0001]|uniref:HNH endonuclease n=1 Tax=Roseomonas sp. KE0001 TaxID=2479201 RepID=UPI0018DF2EEA|nr:HNH endonuclease signature motif containing protein [Roseomonas sp. KE0001]MBI0435415.1 HNH endonuclease [Roseomonas sp. KE0001]